MVLDNLRHQHTKDQNELKKIDAQIVKTVEGIAEYSRQKIENQMVLKEIDLLGDDSSVFKKIGPCLIKQDNVEARANVGKRIEYISEELTRIERQKGTLEGKKKSVVTSLRGVQDKLQAMLGAQQQQAALEAEDA